jgi:ABC-type multidrug transport system permease subunit
MVLDHGKVVADGTSDELRASVGNTSAQLSLKRVCASQDLVGLAPGVCGINPVSHVINAVREMLNLGTVGSGFWWGLLDTAVILLVFIPLTLRVHGCKA